MDYYSIWPAVGLLVILFLVAATPLFKAADSPPVPTKSRVNTLDGLRGFLALGVFLHHSAIYHTYIVDGVWTPPPTRVYALLGPVPVSMFFMITGFLFWSQIVERKGKPDWVRLYVGRVFRIGPIYWVAVSALIFVAFYMTGFQLQQSPMTIARQVGGWLAVGALNGSPINGYLKTGDLIANVTWSLRFEWFFYASLIVTAVFARNRLTMLLFPTFGFIATLAFLVWRSVHGGGTGAMPLVALFFAGMSTASLQAVAPTARLPELVASCLTGGLIIAVFALGVSSYGPASTFLLAGAFYLIANGATLFGLLTSRPARRLGDVSFGIYLLQGFALAAVFAAAPARDFALRSPLDHWLLIAAAGVLLIGLATIAHVFVERPGVDLGRAVVRRIQRKPVAAGSGS